MIRPIVIIALGFILGILWGIYLKISVFLIFFISLIIFFLIKTIKPKTRILKSLFRYFNIILKPNVIILFLISTIISNYYTIYLNKKFDMIYKLNNKDIIISGTIISNVEENDYYDKYIIKIDSLYENKTKKNINFIVLLKKDKKKYQFGDLIKINGKYIKPNEQRNYGGFDYSAYLKTINIYGTIKSTYLETELIKNNNLGRFNIYTNKIKSNIINKLENILDDNTKNIACGILIGYTKKLTESESKLFEENNLSYIIVVSGMHMSYIILILKMTLNNFFNKKFTYLITIFFLIFFSNLIGFNTSILRSSIISILNLISFISYRKSDIKNNISISIIFILINNPFQIYSLGFILSYSSYLGIILFNKIIYEKLNENYLKIIKKREIKELIIKIYSYAKKKYNKKLKIKNNTLIKNLLKTVSITISVQIMLIPILIYYFNNISLSLIISSLIISSFIGIIMYLGFITIILILLNIKLYLLISKFLNFFLKILLEIIKIIDVIPFMKYIIKTPKLIFLLIYYVILCYLIVTNKIKNKRIKRKIEKIFLKINLEIKNKFKKIIFIIFIIIFLFNIMFTLNRETKIFFIDVMQR